ncbi:proline dehydrogenase family protein [Anaerobacillus sp. MEB173]|uniref:proline dehydrogenase family protein n=1 Tax=Anaerobacillus sp. MEB173 TaxID=3383345 RepID=UPI003F9210D1
MEKVMRHFFLYLAKNAYFKKAAKKYGLRLGAKRFVAGQSLEEAVAVIRKLNEQGIAVTVDHLGEFVRNEVETKKAVCHCLAAIRGMVNEELDAQISLKLTSLGLDISRELTLKNMRHILDKAKANNVFVTIDMEDYSRCQATLDIFKKLKKEYDNLGTVLQAYLYRTEKDIQELSQLQSHLRLCKGAYRESPAVAFPQKANVDESFKRMIKAHLLSGSYTAIATHDEKIISYTKQLISKYQIPKEQFEFQMLYGICHDLQLQLVNEGYRTRVYVPYGSDWFGYFMRRLAERPANVWFVLKNFI